MLVAVILTVAIITISSCAERASPAHPSPQTHEHPVHDR
jgi:hypothetical protein